MSFDARLVAYDPGTDSRIGHLPEPLSWQASFPHNDRGALQLSYSTLAAGGDLLTRGLTQGLDVALQVDHGTGWTEPDGARFSLVGRDINPADLTGAVTLKLPSYGWHLAKMLMVALELLETAGDFAGQRLVTAVTAGKVMRAFLDEYGSRHAAPSALTWASFTAATDSAGATWDPTAIAIPYDVGVAYDTVLNALASMGLCDWRTRGRSLRLWKTDTQYADRSADIRLELGRDLVDAPSTESLEDAMGWVLVRGEGSVVATVAPAGAPSAWGVWEGYLQAGGATTVSDAEAMVAQDVEKRARAAGQYTRQLTLLDDGFLPFRDYQPGDAVSALAVTARAAMRVQQVTISRDAQGVLSGSVVLNDRLVPRELKTADKLRALLGSAQLVSGTGSAPSPADTRTPAAPAAPTLGEGRFLDAQGISRCRLAATWPAVTTATDATAMTPASYELWGQPQTSPTAAWRRLTTTTALGAAWETFEPGSTWRIAIVAVGANGKPSTMGPYASITFGLDVTAPNQLSTPTVSTWLGSVVIGWGGLDSGGAAMPVDFDRAEVHLSTVSGFTPSPATRVDTMRRGGTVTVSNLAYGVTYYARLVAYDMSGNASTPSAQSSGVARPALSDDLGPGSVTAEKMVIAGANLTPDPTLQQAAAWTVPASTTRAATGGYAGDGIVTVPAGATQRDVTTPATLIDNRRPYLIPVVPGLTYRVQARVKTTGGPTVANGLWVAAVGIDAAGATIGSGVVGAAVPAAVAAGTWSTPSVIFTAPANAAWMQIQLRAAAAQNTPVTWSTPLAMQMASGSLIVDGSVQAQHFEAELVLTSEVIAGPPTGTHARMNPAGFSAHGPDPADDTVKSFMRLNADGIAFGFNPAVPTARIAGNGEASFASAAVGALSVGGEALDEILWPFPRGRIAYAEMTSPATGVTTTETPVMELRSTLAPGRLYELMMIGTAARSSVAGDIIEWTLRVAYDGAAVTTSSTAIRAGVRQTVGPATLYVTVPPITADISTDGQSGMREARFLLTVKRQSGTGTIDVWGSSGQPAALKLRDEGQWKPATSTGIRYTSTWTATTGWLHHPSSTVSAGSEWSAFMYESTYEEWAQLYFANNAVSGETTRTIATAMSGASIIKAEAAVGVTWANLWRESDGKDYSYSPQVRIHPTANTTSNPTLPGTYATSGAYSPPQLRWTDITAQWTTAHRGLYLSLPPVAAGRWGSAGGPRAAQIRLTYFR